MRPIITTFSRASRLLFLGCFLLSLGAGSAFGQQQNKHLDLFLGADLNYRDIDYVRQYDVLLRLTPSFKWQMGSHWQLSGVALVPVVNQYGDSYGRLSLGILDISKQLKFGPLCLKGSAGIFSSSRYGVDLKAFLPLASWIALEGQWGLTGRYSLDGQLGLSPLQRQTGLVGGDIYLSRWNTQLRGTWVHYLFTDWGFEGEIMRHFTYGTLDLFAQWNNKEGLNGGLKVVMLLPPFHRSSRFLRFRPASNFTIADRIKYSEFGGRTYITDPEENIRHGWFDRDLLPWGSNTMNPDFTTTERSAE